MAKGTPEKVQRNNEMTDLWLSDPNHLTYSSSKLGLMYGITGLMVRQVVGRIRKRRAKEAKDDLSRRMSE